MNWRFLGLETKTELEASASRRQKMVYTKLFIVSGLLLSKEQIITALETVAEEELKAIAEEDLEEALPELFREHLVRANPELWMKHCGGHYPKLYSFPCCSESSGKWFVLGFKVHAYYRKHVHCGGCPENAVCDMCIGETNNGWYDIDAIFNRPTRILREKICWLCNSDQVEVNHRCKLCFINNPEARQNMLSHSEKKLDRFAKEFLDFMPGTYAIAPYYMVDDCLSCT